MVTFFARIEQSPARLPLVMEKKLNVTEEGLAVDMNFFDTGEHTIVIPLMWVPCFLGI